MMGDVVLVRVDLDGYSEENNGRARSLEVSSYFVMSLFPMVLSYENQKLFTPINPHSGMKS